MPSDRMAAPGTSSDERARSQRPKLPRGESDTIEVYELESDEEYPPRDDIDRSREVKGIERLESGRFPRERSSSSANMPARLISRSPSPSRRPRRERNNDSDGSRRRRHSKSIREYDETDSMSRLVARGEDELSRRIERPRILDEDMELTRLRDRSSKVVYESRPPRTSRGRSSRKTRSDRGGSADDARRSRADPSRRHSIVGRSDELPSIRSSSTKEPPPLSRHSSRRSYTSASNTVPGERSQGMPSSVTTPPTRRSSFLGSLFNPATQQYREPEKMIECLTCLSDDIPRSKSAKLPCGHRMCNSCLKRIFKLSVKDPQHMPPKCCTSDHIPLKHVDKLFDDSFKKQWNRKFQEYSTKNRLYCPARRCGEWIKPANIYKEGNRKYGKCSRCKTKVCVICSARWHGTMDCPKDEETNRILEQAKQAGWQRCYNCRTMVELKEGCNHMTCHCTAEFCMICGTKWKSCNCPWFNYEEAELDAPVVYEYLDEGPDEPAPPPRNRLRRRGDDSVTPEEIVPSRRRRRGADESRSRRYQEADDDRDSQGDDALGFGNATGNFMNERYIRTPSSIPTRGLSQRAAAAAAVHAMGSETRRLPPPPFPPYRGNRPNAIPPPPPPLSPPLPTLRRESARGRNDSPRTARSSVGPSRYESEATPRAPVREDADRIRSSLLAGLGAKGPGGGRSRVHAWSTYVEPGVTPPEGVLST